MEIIKMLNFIKSLKFIFMPTYWFLCGKYCKDIDRKMSDLLDNYEFTDIDISTAKLGSEEIWIVGYGFSTMVPWYDIVNLNNGRPSRLTMERGLKKLKEAENKLKSNKL